MFVLWVLSYTVSLRGKRIWLLKTSEGDAEKGGGSIVVNNGYTE